MTLPRAACCCSPSPCSYPAVPHPCSTGIPQSPQELCTEHCSEAQPGAHSSTRAPTARAVTGHSIQSQNYQVPVPRWLGGSFPPVLMDRASFQPQSIQMSLHVSSYTALPSQLLLQLLCGWCLPIPYTDAAHLSSCIPHSQAGAAPPAPRHRIPCPQPCAGGTNSVPVPRQGTWRCHCAAR